MKKKYLIFLITLILTGCNSNDPSVGNQNYQNVVMNNKQANNVSLNEEVMVDDNNDESENGDTKFKLKDSITILNQLINDSYNIDEKQDYEIINLTEEKYLIGTRDDYNNNMNYWYSIYDIDNNSITRIDGIHQIIKNIFYEDNQITFYCNGKNSTTPFNDFPYTYVYDIESGELEQIEVYKSLNTVEDLLAVGGNINASIIEFVEYNSNDIIIGFGIHETSFLAGGAFAPKIQVFHTDDNQINLDIKNVYFDKSIFNELLNNSYIKNIEFDEYIGIDDVIHTIIRLNIDEKYEMYLCDFLYDYEKSKDDFLSLRIRIK